MYYGGPFGIKNQGVFSSGDEIDRFCLTEHQSSLALPGIPPWLLGVTQRTLRFSERGFVPGGHVRALSESEILRTVHRFIYNTECVEINEDSWFEFFKKPRWWDTVWYDPDPIVNSPWSIDKPIIWAQLRLIIELANRILRALINDRHPFMETLLYGRYSYWSDPAWQPAPCPEPHPRTKVLLSQEFLKKRWAAEHGNEPFPFDMSIIPVNRWGPRLEWLLRDLGWCFSTEEDEDKKAFLGMNIGSMIIVNIRDLKSLMRDEMTLAERCSTVFSVTVMILHELSKEAPPPPPTYMMPSYLVHLSFVLHIVIPYNWTSLTTLCMLLLGHAINCARLEYDTHPSLTTLPALANAVQDQFTFREPYIDFDAASEMGCAFEMAMFGGRFRAPQFWADDTIPRKSDNFFHRVDYFHTVIPFIGLEGRLVRRLPYIDQREDLKRQLSQGVLSPELADLIRNWEVRHWAWNEARRDWYPQLYQTWAKTAWNSREREYFYKFGEELKKGLLMFAVMPIRLARSTRKKPSVFITVSLDPSSENKNPSKSFRRHDTAKDFYPESMEASRFYDPFDRPGVPFPLGEFNHFDYLDQVQKVIRHYTKDGAATSKPWVTEIIRVEKNIRQRRLELVAAGLSANQFFSRWVDEVWDFQLPEYDPKEYRYNEKDDVWTEVGVEVSMDEGG
ncbi:hypothetical protein EKO27_g8363 [Xylaria grammica]|uniref:Uncharacterized protein n=1 Tax=Xylaria grammica TaxID=363999 RepID=A0A439CX19_9PEZI|nr:hypothetical protein EKO27_g8363 [Xylaria grammica]